jgi:hypothetical protein
LFHIVDFTRQPPFFFLLADLAAGLDKEYIVSYSSEEKKASPIGKKSFSGSESVENNISFNIALNKNSYKSYY